MDSRLWALFLAAFLSAFPLRIEEAFEWFRLRDLRLQSCPSVRIERFILKSIDNRALRFWPLVLKERRRLKDLIETQEPLRAIAKTGWSSLKVKIAPLDVAAVFYWDGRRWCLSRDGRVWLSDHPLNPEYYGVISDDGFKVTIDQSMPSPMEGSGPVRRFLYDVPGFLKDKDGLFSQSWPGAAEALRLYREGGEDLLSVYLKTEEGIYVTVILNRDWPRGLAGVMDLLDSENLKSGAVIDASYKDKIVVKGF